MINKKTRKKLYKRGKQWVICSMAFSSVISPFVPLISQQASANQPVSSKSVTSGKVLNQKEINQAVSYNNQATDYNNTIKNLAKSDSSISIVSQGESYQDVTTAQKLSESIKASNSLLYSFYNQEQSSVKSASISQASVSNSISQANESGSLSVSVINSENEATYQSEVAEQGSALSLYNNQSASLSAKIASTASLAGSDSAYLAKLKSENLSLSVSLSQTVLLDSESAQSYSTYLVSLENSPMLSSGILSSEKASADSVYNFYSAKTLSDAFSESSNEQTLLTLSTSIGSTLISLSTELLSDNLIDTTLVSQYYKNNISLESVSSLDFNGSSMTTNAGSLSPKDQSIVSAIESLCIVNDSVTEVNNYQYLVDWGNDLVNSVSLYSASVEKDYRDAAVPFVSAGDISKVNLSIEKASSAFYLQAYRQLTNFDNVTSSFAGDDSLTSDFWSQAGISNIDQAYDYYLSGGSDQNYVTYAQGKSYGDLVISDYYAQSSDNLVFASSTISYNNSVWSAFLSAYRVDPTISTDNYLEWGSPEYGPFRIGIGVHSSDPTDNYNSGNGKFRNVLYPTKLEKPLSLILSKVFIPTKPNEKSFVPNKFIPKEIPIPTTKLELLRLVDVPKPIYENDEKIKNSGFDNSSDLIVLSALTGLAGLAFLAKGRNKKDLQ